MSEIQDFTFKYQPWARLQGFYAGLSKKNNVYITSNFANGYKKKLLVIFVGAVIELIFFQFDTAFGVLNLLASLIIMGMDYPEKLDKLGKIGTNYYFRALVYTAFVFPGLMLAPTTTGVFCLFFSAMTYLVAALRNE